MSIGFSVSKFGNGWSWADKTLPVTGKQFFKFFDEVPSRMASALAQEMQKAIKSGGLRPNSTATVIIKGSGKPLVHSGDLYKSIKKIKDNTRPFSYYAGIDPKAKSSTGKSLVDIALAQNAGYIIPVTAELRGFMASHGITVSPNTQFFVVPPRPFLSRAFEKAASRLDKIANDAGRKTVKIFALRRG